MANIVFQNGFVKEAFRENLQKYFDGEITEEELKAKELKSAKEEDYWTAAGVRFVLQWICAPDYAETEVGDFIDISLPNYVDPQENENQAETETE